MATSVYVLYNFNSYHNRVLKKFDTLNEYTTGYSYDVIANANFDYKDGVTSSVTYNLGTGFNYDNSPNYALVVDNTNGILSRWYVVDGVKTRGGQYVLTLLRDGIADYLGDIKNAPMYLEKGALTIDKKPFIYNSEDIQFNQIKTSETLLKDRTSCPWIIGFMAQKQPEGTSEPFTTSISTNMTGQPDVTYSSMASYPYWDYMGSPYNGDTNYYKAVSMSGSAITWLTVYINAYDSTGITGRTSTEGYTYYYTPNSGWSYITGEGQNPSPTQFNTAYRCNYEVQPTLFRKIYRAIAADPNITELARNYAALYYSGIHTAAQGEAFAAEAGKIVKTNGSATQPTTGTTYAAGLYSLSIPYNSTGFVGDIYYYDDTEAMATTLTNTASQLHQAVLNILSANASTWGLEYISSSNPTAAVAQEAKFYLVEATPTSATQITFSFEGTEKGLGDAPYRMFALPYNDNIVKWKFGASDANVISSNKNINMAVAQGIAKTFSGTWLYDLQLVPFCPFVKSDRVTVNNNNEVIIDTQGLTWKTDYTTVSYNGTTMSYILWCEYSQVDNYQIPYTISAANNAIDMKINNQCDMYRLSSPSYNSIYEFNAEKNGGVNGFDMDLVYKPFDSYIHINPNWGGLYGQDFNDARGLVFTGPFNLPQTTSAWMQYKLNNMNYQNSFDRQIQNMDKMHSLEMKELNWKIATGAVQGAVSGAAAGALGGPAGMIAGAVAGGVLSTGAGLLDRSLAKERYGETLDYTQDQFNYSLQNVQAQASTLSKVSSFTPNNKVFPVLEYYTCTEPEKDAFREKMKYNGMSINAIMSLNTLYSTWPTDDELKRYTKGKLIRLNINEDNHLVEHITEELNKGVFI